MEPESADLSSRLHCKEKARSARVERFCPRLDIALAASELTGEEMEKCREVDVEKCDLYLNFQTPEKSVWLSDLFAELESSEAERRFFALCRIECVLRGSIATQGSQVYAGLSAYLLEHGILNNVIRTLRAAQESGDVCLLAGGSKNIRAKLLKQEVGGVLGLSKVTTCCDVLHALMADARTTRFIQKAIPNLTCIVEGAYLSRNVESIEERGRKIADVQKGRPPGFLDSDKYASLSVLGTFACWSSAQEKAFIASRKVLLRQMMRDAMDGTELGHQILDLVISLSTNVLLLPQYPPSLFEDFVKVAFKAMEVSGSAMTIKQAFVLMASLIKLGKVSPAQLDSPNTRKAFLCPLLALTTCPHLDLKLRPSVHSVICLVDESFLSIFGSENAWEKIQKRIAAYPWVPVRTAQLCEMYAANQRGCLTTDNDGTAWAEGVSKEELEAELRPCRQCSHSSCSNTESAPRQFRLCSSCRLAIYCSRECQKLAWKEGHRERCQSGGGRSSIRECKEHTKGNSSAV